MTAKEKPNWPPKIHIPKDLRHPGASIAQWNSNVQDTEPHVPVREEVRGTR